MLVARRFVVKGRVQNVGFRLFVERAASVEGIHGWVANREDGAVEMFTRSLDLGSLLAEAKPQSAI